MVRIVDSNFTQPLTVDREWPRTLHAGALMRHGDRRRPLIGRSKCISSQLQDWLSRIHTTRLSRASGALVNQILGGILILNVVHPEINFNLLSGLESGKAWIRG
jgi:hypothetical protein